MQINNRAEEVNKSRCSGENTIKRLELKKLLDNDKELVIVHDNHEYHLRITRNNKLILTK